MKKTFFKSAFLTILSAACISSTMTGCTFGRIPRNNPHKDEEEVYDFSDYQFFDTADGLFHFGTEPILAFAESDGTDDYEYSFTTGEQNSLIGIMSVSGLHQTAKGFGEGTLPDYQELYSDAAGSSISYNGVLAYRITYSDSGVDYISIMLQYGNGDIFIINMTENADKNEIEKIAENIIKTIKYNGERRKTEPEEFECGYFSLTVPPEWYVKSETEEGVVLALNLQDSMREVGCSYRLNAVPDKDNIRELANERFSKISESSECTTSETEFLGNEAFAVSFSQGIMDFEVNICYRYFKINGMCYELITTLPADDEVEYQYQKMTYKIDNSIEFK